VTGTQSMAVMAPEDTAPTVQRTACRATATLTESRGPARESGPLSARQAEGGHGGRLRHRSCRIGA